MQVEIENIEDFLLPDTSAGRSKGVHVSSIIRCIAGDTGILAAEYCEDLGLVDVRDMTKIGSVSLLRIHAGFAWERYYIPLLPGVRDHASELEVDGVFMSPDGDEIETIVVQGRKTNTVIVHEVKATYKSTRTVGILKDQFMWMSQIKAYCKAYGTTRAVLHVLFWCGDYSRPIGPMLKRYHIQFTQEEIDDNWSLLTEYRDLRLSTEAMQK